jgi:hypothetical protein
MHPRGAIDLRGHRREVMKRLATVHDDLSAGAAMR